MSNINITELPWYLRYSYEGYKLFKKDMFSPSSPSPHPPSPPPPPSLPDEALTYITEKGGYDIINGWGWLETSYTTINNKPALSLYMCGSPPNDISLTWYYTNNQYELYSSHYHPPRALSITAKPLEIKKTLEDLLEYINNNNYRSIIQNA